MKIFSALKRFWNDLWPVYVAKKADIHPTIAVQIAYLLEQNRQFEAYMRRKVEELKAQEYHPQRLDEAKVGPPRDAAKELALTRDILRVEANDGLIPAAYGPEVFDDFYRQRLAEAGPPRDATEELAIACDILQAVVTHGLTPAANGGVCYYVRRGTMEQEQWRNEYGTD